MSYNNTYFSIIIPTHNRATILKEAIKSINFQTFHDWELIIVDDGSTDNTKEVVASFKDARINYFWQENKERSTARNLGINHAKGTYLLFLDSDDYYEPSHLSSLHSLITGQKEPIGIFNSFVKIINDNGKIIKVIPPLPSLQPKVLIKEILTNYRVIFSQNLCVHREILTHHKFEEKFSLWEDTHLWLRVLSQYPLYPVPSETVVIRAHVNSGIVKGMSKVKIRDVERYVEAVNDLFENYRAILPIDINDTHRINYLHAKYKMYLYQTRVKKQYKLAYILLWRSIKNKFSFSFHQIYFLKLSFSFITRIPLP